MTNPIDPAGLASALLIPHLLKRLVMRGILTREDAVEIADGALLEAEEMLANEQGGQQVRALLDSMVKDFRSPQ